MPTVAESGRLTVISGANPHELENALGMTVGEIRNRLADVINIPNPSQAMMNAVAVDDEYVIREMDTQLEFRQPAREKGNGRLQ